MGTDQADGEADGEVSSEEEQEKPGNFIQGKPRMSLVRSYRHTWKSRANHFLRYSDVKSKDERRPTVNELANQKFVLQKINGWKILWIWRANFPKDFRMWEEDLKRQQIRRSPRS